MGTHCFVNLGRIPVLILPFFLHGASLHGAFALAGIVLHGPSVAKWQRGGGRLRLSGINLKILQHFLRWPVTLRN